MNFDEKTPAREFATRRRLLRMLGLTAASAPFLNPERILAATPPPKRLLILFTPGGGHDARWKPTGGETSFTLTTQLKPLEPVRARSLILGGVDLKSVEDRSDPRGDDHLRANTHLLTNVKMISKGADNLNDSWGGGISLDQYVADKIKGTTRAASIVAGVASKDSGTARQRISYRGSGDAVPPQLDPWATFNSVFEGITAGGGSTVSDPNVPRRKTVLDFVRADLERMKGRLTADDKCRVDQHLASVTSLEEAVAKTVQVSVGCQRPNLGTAQRYSTAAHGTIADAWSQLMVSAFQCDLTRVGVIMYGQGGGGSADPVMNFAPVNVNAKHHERGHDSDANAKADMDRIHIWEAAQFAKLVAMLEAAKDDDGSSLLDNTLVWWATDLGNAYRHQARDTRQVLAGGGVRGGRFLDLAGTTHAKLLVSVLNLMGIQQSSFGRTEYGTGGLANLT